jgi:hypothetical protein
LWFLLLILRVNKSTYLGDLQLDQFLRNLPITK